jgi:hypothetical protein
MSTRRGGDATHLVLVALLPGPSTLAQVFARIQGIDGDARVRPGRAASELQQFARRGWIDVGDGAAGSAPAFSLTVAGRAALAELTRDAMARE